MVSQSLSELVYGFGSALSLHQVCLGPIRDPGYDPVRVGWVRLEKSQIEVTGFGRLVTNHVVR